MTTHSVRDGLSRACTLPHRQTWRAEKPSHREKNEPVDADAGNSKKIIYSFISQTKNQNFGNTEGPNSRVCCLWVPCFVCWFEKSIRSRGILQYRTANPLKEKPRGKQKSDTQRGSWAKETYFIGYRNIKFITKNFPIVFRQIVATTLQKNNIEREVFISECH